MIPLAPCQRCGAQAAGYMDIDFSCNRRRCAVRKLLNDKKELAVIAYDGDEGRRAQREALKALLVLMQFSVEHEDETIGMEKDELQAWVAKHAPR